MYLEGVGIDSGLKATFERLMPIYRKKWWSAHDRANREWIAAVQPLVDRHGASLSQAIARAYEVTWPAAPVPVDVSVLADANGAYATSSPAHVTISSQDARNRGNAALELLFHESSHTMAALYEGVSRAATEHRVSVPPQLSHAVLFYTAGELTTRELKTHGVEDYVETGVKQNVYVALRSAGCREKIVEHWTPHLDGKRTIAEAFSALVLAFK